MFLIDNFVRFTQFICARTCVGVMGECVDECVGECVSECDRGNFAKTLRSQYSHGRNVSTVALYPRSHDRIITAVTFSKLIIIYSCIKGAAILITIRKIFS